MKLVVTRTRRRWPKAGGVHRRRRVPRHAAADHRPRQLVEGWIPACYPLNPPQTCDGAFVVNEPMGAQSWFPSNNYPTDKATFDTLITVPNAKTALGVGELAARTRQRRRHDHLALDARTTRPRPT